MSEKSLNNENQPNVSVKNAKNIFTNKKLLIVLVLLTILVILIPIGYALFSQTKNDETSTKIGEINVNLIEDWPEPGATVTTGDGTTETYDEFGITRTTKTIYGQTTGDMDAYVRVRLIPIVEYNTDTSGQGDWIVAPVAQDKIIISVDAGGWVQSGSYWYYTKILKKDENTSEEDEKTTEMDISWQVAELPSELSAYPIRTDVRVILEYAQTTNDMWKELFQIQDLPTGVERVQE